MAAVDVKRVLMLEAELAATSEQLADIERNAAWHSAFNVRTALWTIARTMDEVAAVRETLVPLLQEDAGVAQEVARLQAATEGGFTPLRRWSPQYAVDQKALDGALSARAGLRKRIEDMERRQKAAHGEIARVEAELERWRAFDFPGSVRRRMKLEDRVSALRAEITRVQGRELRLAPI